MPFSRTTVSNLVLVGCLLAVLLPFHTPLLLVCRGKCWKVKVEAERVTVSAAAVLPPVELPALPALAMALVPVPPVPPAEVAPPPMPATPLDATSLEPLPPVPPAEGTPPVAFPAVP